MATTWRVLSPELKAEGGYCVFSLNYGGAKMVIPPFKTVYGVTDIRLSARQLAQFVDTVLSRTGSSQVDIVGHSQGGTLARQYLKFEGGANSADPASNKVRTLVTLGATNHGTTWAGDILQRLYELAASLGFGSEAAYQFLFGMAMSQQTVGSPLLQDLNADGDTEAGVMYTVIASRADNMVTPPPERTFLSTNGRAADVNNIWFKTAARPIRRRIPPSPSMRGHCTWSRSDSIQAMRTGIRRPAGPDARTTPAGESLPAAH